MKTGSVDGKKIHKSKDSNGLLMHEKLKVMICRVIVLIERKTAIDGTLDKQTNMSFTLS